MKITYGKLLSSRAGLSSLAVQSLPVAISLRIARFLAKIEDELRIFADKHAELAKRHGGDPDAEGEFTIAEESRAAFDSDFEAMMAEEIEMDVPTLRPEHLEGAKISPAILSGIMWLIDV